MENGATRKNGSTEPHPFDPLTAVEIRQAVAVVRKHNPEILFFNTVSLLEPRKKEMLAWLGGNGSRPRRCADVVGIGEGSSVFDMIVDLEDEKVEASIPVPGVQPRITVDELKVVEGLCRKDPKVIEQCGILGIPPSDMDKVYCDPWSIGYHEKYGAKLRLQQGLMYYRPHIDDNQYTYPLDFCPIYDAERQQIIDIDIPKVRRPLSKAKPSNYHAEQMQAEGGYRTDLKPIEITQPEGRSFTLHGRQLKWANWSVHIGFNHREGLVLNNLTFYDRDQQRERGVIYRLSMAEMVVPYGNPEHPHQRKHAFDLGEYGCGAMTNSLRLGCDCKGDIAYLDADFVNHSGDTYTIENAVCIHEEDAGILWKHTDFRDDTSTIVRARKLVISQVFTAANYEYCLYWSLHLDGTIMLEVKLTGILNTYVCDEGEDLHGWGARVYPGVNAHNHQHLFCLRVDPNIDGPSNSVFQVDARPGAAPVGSKENFYGNAFFAERTRYDKVADGVAEYDASTARTWDLANESSVNRHSGLPAAYKLVSREVPALLPKKDSVVWKRAGFARHAVHVTRYQDDQLHPAGRHVPQTSGEGPAHPRNADLPQWVQDSADQSLVNEDVVLWHCFGHNHFASPEDFPVMPVDPVVVMLRPRNFFERNPALDVPPEKSTWPSMLANGHANGHTNGNGDACH